jgi:Phospholipid-translocating P-type ATPase C-terminal
MSFIHTRLQDVKAEVVELNPGLYAETMGSTRTGFFGVTLRWVCSALWHSAVALAVPLLALWAPDSSGKSSGGLTAFGTTAYTTVVLIVNLKVSIAVRHFRLSGCQGIALPTSMHMHPACIGDVLPHTQPLYSTLWECAGRPQISYTGLASFLDDRCHQHRLPVPLSDHGGQQPVSQRWRGCRPDWRTRQAHVGRQVLASSAVFCGYSTAARRADSWRSAAVCTV